MYERFTERARQVVVLAQDEARALNHNHIGSEHLLMGLIREQEGIAARVLESLDVTEDHVRNRIRELVGERDGVPNGEITLTPRANKIHELSLREALSLGHQYIGTEHILLGIARENEGTATRILGECDVTADGIRNEIIRMLSGPGRRPQKAAEVVVNVSGSLVSERDLAVVVREQIAAAGHRGPMTFNVAKDCRSPRRFRIGRLTVSWSRKKR